MKNLIKCVALGAVLAVSAISAHADPITGGITISGSSYVNGAQTIVTFSNPGFAFGGTGTLSSADFDLIDMLSPLTATSTGNLFTTAYGPDAITFILSGLSFIDESLGQVQVNGTGTLTEAGYSNTPASFQLSTATKYQQSSFTLDTVIAATPEPSSLMLLGTGLIAAAGLFFRRRRRTGTV